MEKIKEWWKSLKYWQKGLITGLLISIILSIINTFLLYGFLGAILFYPINWLLFDFVNLFNLRACGESCWWILILVGDIEFVIVLSSLGMLIGYKSDIKTRNKK